MAPTPATKSNATVTIELTEWERISSAEDPRLASLSFVRDSSAQRIVESLRRCIDIREGYRGLEIASTSFVGRVDIGLMRLAIAPKIASMPLAKLLRYAYGLRDIDVFEETYAPTTRHGLHDLLILMLVAEVDELLHRGLARQYVTMQEKLESPRGRILIEELSRKGGIAEARLPCRHFERQINWHLN